MTTLLYPGMQELLNQRRKHEYLFLIQNKNIIIIYLLFIYI